ncbi:hypothetical protein KAFR_0C02870 [Kazachstania africana CBS 2517]|uniref:GOLD domain-containing protein n=1 Tax=Kazachstania africana (strain ATCC 22294 / BCRC 22015 / CBS 2517 / CECT 1963 / NBRC 1671 / NRRL Y-8276) TaxID=1071382 RepID=H2ASD0_KAZAF|nr:hypothetical protein KAFR_0C02870 [Kazachstania africana CBS 2517]CCF57280.1 hypothetical protein KAFR_0C02870 [Kazachstania africana CBS 2517]
MRFSIIATFVVSTLLTSVATAHNVLLPPYGRRCFFEELNQNDELAITYQFGDRNPQSSSQLSGDFVIYSVERNEVIRTVSDASHGEVTVVVPYKGKYQYCFGNEKSGIDTKDVTFNIHGVVYIDEDDSKTLGGAIKKLSKLVREVKDEQSYIVIRERTHRNTAESTNDRVKWWSVFQVGVVVANSVFQIYYLKRFFEVTSLV